MISPVGSAHTRVPTCQPRLFLARREHQRAGSGSPKKRASRATVDLVASLFNAREKSIRYSSPRPGSTFSPIVAEITVNVECNRGIKVDSAGSAAGKRFPFSLPSTTRRCLFCALLSIPVDTFQTEFYSHVLVLPAAFTGENVRELFFFDPPLILLRSNRVAGYVSNNRRVESRFLEISTRYLSRINRTSSAHKIVKSR